MIADADRVAAESSGVLIVDDDRVGHVGFDDLATVFVEGGRIVDHLAAAERAEARVEMIEPRIGQLQAQHAPAEAFGHQRVGSDFGAEVIAAEQLVSGEERVAGPLEEHVFGKFVDGETVFAKPRTEDRLLAAAHRKTEPRQDHAPIGHQAGIGGEHQVGQTGLRVDEHQLGPTRVGESLAEVGPLRLRKLRLGPVETRHPRVDLVLDGVILRRGH